MNLRDLEYLVAVADHLHFGKAAEACHISQPTLSMQVKKLEEYLGVALIERTNKQVMMTPMGKDLAERARAIVQQSRELRSAAKAAQDPFAGEFRLGAFPTLAPYLLPRIVPALHQNLSKLTWLLVEEKSAELLRLLQQGELDAILLALPIGEENLESEVLLQDAFMLAVPPTHTFAQKKKIRLEEVSGEPLLLLDEGHCLRDQALALCSIIGTGENHAFRATSMETLRHMVAAGVGITLMPTLARVEGDGVVYIPFEGTVPSRTIGMVWRKSSVRRSAIQEMIHRIKEVML